MVKHIFLALCLVLLASSVQAQFPDEIDPNEAGRLPIQPKAVEVNGRIELDRSDSYFESRFGGFLLAQYTDNVLTELFYIVTSTRKQEAMLRSLDKQAVTVKGYIGYRNSVKFLFLTEIVEIKPKVTQQLWLEGERARMDSWWTVQYGFYERADGTFENKFQMRHDSEFYEPIEFDGTRAPPLRIPVVGPPPDMQSYYYSQQGE
jgi:hypothetical protein